MGAVPDPWRKLSAEVRAIKEHLRRLGNASPFFGTGMRPNGDGGIDSDNFVTGASGYSFKANGNAEFNDLTLRGGIIGNDALANPLNITQSLGNATNFTVGTSEAAKASVSLTVPEGFTQFSCMAIGGLSAVNPTGALDYVNARIFIDSFFGDALWDAASGSGGSASLTVFKQGQLSGLVPGATVEVSLRAWTDYAAWGASSANIASLNLLAFWLR